MSGQGGCGQSSIAAGSAATHRDVQTIMRYGEKNVSAWLTSSVSSSACLGSIVSNCHGPLAPSSADYFRDISTSLTHRPWVSSD